VTALFHTHALFFLASDNVQVKYEMPRAHVVDGQTVTAAARGYSRAEFNLVAAAFEDDKDVTGLLSNDRLRFIVNICELSPTSSLPPSSSTVVSSCLGARRLRCTSGVLPLRFSRERRVDWSGGRDRRANRCR
jgi:hypothetical protein